MNIVEQTKKTFTQLGKHLQNLREKKNITLDELEFAEKLKFFLQILRNGFVAVCALSRVHTATHTPKVVFEKVRKIVIFRLFPHTHYPKQPA